MLSLPDFKEKQVVFIESENQKKIAFRNDNLTITEEGKITYQISCHKIFCVYIVGEISVTSVLLQKAVYYGICVILLRRNFSVYAVIGSETEGNYLLRQKQYSWNDEMQLPIQIVKNKITNQMHLLKEKRKKNVEELSAIKNLKQFVEKANQAKTPEELLGYEGNASKLFFALYFKPMKWHRRAPRTKYDIANTLLDIGYTYLFNFVEAHLRLYGFDVYFGFYHRLFYQRKSLVCDVQEPFRCIIDKALLKAQKLGQINEKDFTTRRGTYELKFKEARKYSEIFLKAIMHHKNDIFLYTQSFYRAIMKESQEYPFFSIKQ